MLHFYRQCEIRQSKFVVQLPDEYARNQRAVAHIKECYKYSDSDRVVGEPNFLMFFRKCLQIKAAAKKCSK